MLPYLYVSLHINMYTPKYVILKYLCFLCVPTQVWIGTKHPKWDKILVDLIMEPLLILIFNVGMAMRYE